VVFAWSRLQIDGRISRLYRDFVSLASSANVFKTKAQILVRKGMVTGGLLWLGFMLLGAGD